MHHRAVLTVWRCHHAQLVPPVLAGPHVIYGREHREQGAHHWICRRQGSEALGILDLPCLAPALALRDGELDHVVKQRLHAEI